MSLLGKSGAHAETVTIRPGEYTRAFKNPLMGFRGIGPIVNIPPVSLWKTYIRWNSLEDSESDGLDRIRGVCNQMWKGVEDYNLKVIPRVYLEWPNAGDHLKATEIFRYWPADLTPGDLTSDRFLQRLVRLVENLSVAWDTDPRVAYIEMGLIGLWGEHHDPDVTVAMQAVLGDTFTKLFKHKRIMVRHPWDFAQYRFGVYWDSFAHADQENHARGIRDLGSRWKHAVIGGELAYNWGNYVIQPGDSLDDTMTDPAHLGHLVNSIRSLHANHLGLVGPVSRERQPVAEALEAVHMILGYRFVVEQVEYTGRVDQGGVLTVGMSVKNTGSSPFYYNWPVAVALLDGAGNCVWREAFRTTDIRNWLPGDDWDAAQGQYAIPAAVVSFQDSFLLPSDLKTGEYSLALAILDPGGNLPCARLAIRNYRNGGYHPIGMVGIGCTPTTAEIPSQSFDDLAGDDSLHYIC